MDPVRDFSAGVFQNRYALEVMARLAELDEAKPRFYVRQLAELVGRESSEIKPVFRKLERAGLIVELPERGQYGNVYYEKVDPDDRFWGLIAEMYRSRLG